MSFDPHMNGVYMTGSGGWLATNSFTVQADGRFQGSMTTALASALLNRHQVPLRHTDAAHVGASYAPTVLNLVMTSGGRIIAGAADLAAVANGNVASAKCFIRITDPEGVAV
jgi:hypothetical protein